MVENHGAIQSLCRLVNVDSPDLLLYLSDIEFKNVCDKAVQDGSATLGDVLSWRYVLSKLRKTTVDADPPVISSVNVPTGQQQSCDELSLSINGSARCLQSSCWKTETETSDTMFVSKISAMVKDIPIPGGKLYQGYGESRSISWFVDQLNDEAQLHGLQPKPSWMYVTRAFAPSARGSLITNVRLRCTSNEWMKDYLMMLNHAIAYLLETYKRSNDTAYHESRLNDIKQKKDEGIFDYLDRLQNEAAQAESCKLSVTPEQVGRYYRRGLLSGYADVANKHYASILYAPELACEVDRYCRMNHIRVVGPTPNRRTNDNKSNTLSDSTPGFMLTPKEFEYVRANRICFSFAKYGSCNRDECAFKHVSQSQVKEAVASTPEVAGPLSTSKTSPSTDSTLTTHKVCHDSTEQKRTLRSYDLGDLFIEIDTGCSTSIISSHAFEVLSESNLVRDVVSVDQSFSTASGPNALHANKRAYVEISVYDINNVAHKLVWQPYVVNSVIPQCDGLFGKDVLLFGDRGLEILLADGAYDLALFWCSRTDVIECQFTSPVSSPDTSVSSLGEDGNDVLSDGAMTLQADIDVPDFTTTTYKLPDDPIDHVIYDGVWYRISVQRKGDGSRYFLCDFSTEFGEWLDSLPMSPVPKVHWKWAKAEDICRKECTTQLEKFVTGKKLVPVQHVRKNLFRSNFYGVAGRKRHRVVTPLLQLNNALRPAITKYKLPNPQGRITAVMHRLRCAECAYLLDVRDAYMCIRCGEVMASKLEIWWYHSGFSVWRFLYLIYGSSVAPLTLELCMAYLELRCPKPLPCNGLPKPATFMDDIVRPCHITADSNVCDDTIAVYANHQFTLTNDRLCSDRYVTALGTNVSLDSITYRQDKYATVCELVLPDTISYRRGLEVLGLIINEPDLLGLHILPVKHALVGLLSHWRHMNDAKWDQPVPLTLFDLIREWLSLVALSPLPVVPRRIDMTAAFDVYTDSSRSLQCYQIFQTSNVPIMCEQFTISASESHFHINVLELSSVWRALTRLQLLCLDTALSITSVVTVHVDSKTALSILCSHRVPRGPFQALYQKYLDLIQIAGLGLHLQYVYVASKENPADAGTRCELLGRIHSVRAQLADNSQEDEQVMAVRRRSEFDDDNESPLVRRSARLAKKRRTDETDIAEDSRDEDDEVNNKDALVDEDEILFNYIRPDYDFVPLALFDDDLPAPMYLSDLNGYITNIEIVDVTDPAQQLRLASIGHNVAHESDDIVCDRLRKFYRWPNMKATITKAAQLCEPCNRTKTRPNDCKFKQIPHVPRLVPIPFHKVGMDGLGPYGSVYVLTLTDYFTGYIMVRVTMGAPKTHDVRQLINHVYRVFGMFPRIVRSDNASIFQSAAKDFPGLWTFSPIHGSPSNGLAERRHRDINQKLRRLMLQGVAGTDLISWCDILDKVCGEMNNAPVKRAKGLSPTDVLMYYPCTNLLTGTNRQQDPDRHVVWSNYRADSLKTNAQRIAVAHQQLKIGQQVMARISQPNSKLSPRYNPAVITRILGPNRVELDNGSVVHSRDLKILQSLPVEEVEDDVEEE